MTTLTGTLKHAIDNVAYLTPHSSEEGQSRSAALQRLGSLHLLLADLFDAIDHDDTTRAYNEVDHLIETVRLSKKGHTHARAAD